MTPAELVEALSIQIYSPPLSEHRSSGRIADTSAPLSVAMLILDFDTEVAMNGSNSFLGNSNGDYARETVTALEIIGCAGAARLLSEIIGIATKMRSNHSSRYVGTTGDTLITPRRFASNAVLLM